MKALGVRPRKPRLPRFLTPAALAAALLATGLPARAAGAEHATAASVTGLPVMRHYPYTDIGDVSPGVQLSVDAFGRLLLFQERTCLAFDDKLWSPMQIESDAGIIVSCLGRVPDGRIYFGGPGAWGILEQTAADTLQLRSLRSAAAPEWTGNNQISFVAATAGGAYFANDSGVIHHDARSGAERAFPLPEIGALFVIGDTAYASSFTRGTVRLDPERGPIELPSGAAGRIAFDAAVPWDAGHVLGHELNGRFWRFDGQEFTPWASDIDALLPAGVARLLALDNGQLAVLVRGHGLFLLDRDGRAVLALDGGEFASLTDVCATEPGVLWAAGAGGVTKILSDAPQQIFDHRLGLMLTWPRVVRHGDSVYVFSSGRLFASVPGRHAEPTRFQELPVGLTGGVWSVVSTDHGLLIGNGDGVFCREDDGRVVPVLAGLNVKRLARLADDACVAIGESQVAALRWTRSGWQPEGDPIPGVGFPSTIVEVAPGAVWVELGIDRVGRIAWRNGRLSQQVFDQLPWRTTTPSWLGVGVVGSVAVVSRSPNDHLFFDEQRNAWVEAPELSRLLALAPGGTWRPHQTADGTLWLPHGHGLLRVTPAGADGQPVVEPLATIRERFPALNLAGPDEVWITGHRRLARVVPVVGARPAPVAPVILGVSDARTGRPLYNALQPGAPEPRRFPYASNSLDVQCFAGTFAHLRSPGFQYKLDGDSGDWSAPLANSTIRLNQLHEGAYRLAIRLIDSAGPIGHEAHLAFSIAPPFYRTTLAYLGYGVAGLGLLLGGSRWLLRRARVRNAELEAVIHARTRELEIAVDHAQQAARAKNQFLANISHEIRTPMNGVIGLSNLLVDTPLNPEQQEYAQAIRKSGEALLAIINDILDVSKLESGKVQLELGDFRLDELVEESVHLLRPTATAKGIRLKAAVSPELPTAVHGDATRLRQVLLNLMGNGVKFTEHGGVSVRLTAEPAAAAGNNGRATVRIEVEDTGIGIPPEAAERLFQPFTQVDESMTRRYGGTGLGLAISRQLVELMGGRIGVRARPGGGSVFWCVVPLAPAQTPVPPGPAPAAPCVAASDAAVLRRLHVLVAEDNPVNQKLVLAQLKRLGCEAACVGNGHLVLDAVQQRRPDVILMDCQMPELDGYETARRIRSTVTAHIPIIAMTAHAMQGEREKCLAAGMDDYLAKPVRLADLTQALLRASRETAPAPDRAGQPGADVAT